MKKRGIQILLTVIYLFVLTCCTNKEEQIRLKINANSNDFVDQEIKYDVKMFLQGYLEKITLSELNLKTLEKDLNEKFLDTKIIVERKKVSYEAKSYKGRIVPSGSYDTILITLGKGEGKNFWTLLYPEFFNISFEDDHEVEYRSYIYDLLTGQ